MGGEREVRMGILYVREEREREKGKDERREREREREREEGKKEGGKRERGREESYFVERRNTQQSKLPAALKLLISLSLSILFVLPSSPGNNKTSKHSMHTNTNHQN